MGAPVTFQARASIASDPSRPLLLGPSDPIAGDWDVILWHGKIEGSGQPVFSVSRERADGTWEPWTEAEVKVFPNGRFWAKARVAGAGGRIRLLQGPSTAAGRIEIYSFEAFKEGKPSVGGGGARAQNESPTAPRPPTLTRYDWKAQPPRDAYEVHIPEAITLHHTAGAQTSTLEESVAELRFIQDYHQNGRGWDDIGYHFIVDSAGRIFEGRPETVVGAHALGRNVGNVGIAVLGYHHPPKSHPVNGATLAAVVALGRYLSAAYLIDASKLQGHRDMRATSCPGDGLYRFLPEIRRRLTPPGSAGSGSVAGS